MAVKVKKRDPMKTRNDRVRLGPLSIKQLEAMVDKARPRVQDKVNRRLLALKKR